MNIVFNSKLEEKAKENKNIDIKYRKIIVSKGKEPLYEVNFISHSNGDIGGLMFIGRAKMEKYFKEKFPNNVLNYIAC